MIAEGGISSESTDIFMGRLALPATNLSTIYYLLILQHPLAGIMCRCPVCFRPGVSAVKVKIGQMDKNR